MRIIYFIIIVAVLILGVGKTEETLRGEKRKEHFLIGISPWLSPQYDNNIEGFKAALAQRGFVDGKNVSFLTKNPDGDPKEQQQIIQSFIDQRVDLIYALTAPGAKIAQSLTQEIPIVFSLVNFPVDAGLIASNENSGNNLTGTRPYVSAAKQFFAFERVVPFVRSVAFVHKKDDADSMRQYREFETLFTERNIKLIDISSENLDDLTNQLNEKQDQFDALYLACDPFVSGGADKISIEFCRTHRKPNFACSLDATLNGALVGNVVNFYNIGKLSGEKAALILMGADPQWIQTEASDESFVVINKASAKEIGIDLP